MPAIFFRGLLFVLAVGFVCLGLVRATSAEEEATQPWELDPAHTAIYFKISHLGTSQTYGRFNEVAGSFATGPGASFEFAVPVASIDTNLEDRDNHLRSSDFFNATQFPVITFKSTSVTREGDVYQVTGDLHLHGVTQSVTVEMKKLAEIQDPWGNTRTGFDTTLVIKRSDFGMSNMLDMVGDEVTLMISFEGTR